MQQNNCPTAGTILTGLLELENRKRTEIAVLQVEAETRNSRKSQQFLIDYWLEIGKLRRERKVEGDPKSRWVYYFIADDSRRELSLQDSWVKFFQAFDSINLFIQFFELDTPAYDPWNDPKWISMEVQLGRDHRKETYRFVEEL